MRMDLFCSFLPRTAHCQVLVSEFSITGDVAFSITITRWLRRHLHDYALARHMQAKDEDFHFRFF